MAPHCRIPASALYQLLQRRLPPQLAWQLLALSSVLLVAGVPTPPLPISQSFVTLCLVKTFQRSLESVLITTNYDVNSARFFYHPFLFLSISFWRQVNISAGMGDPDYRFPCLPTHRAVTEPKDCASAAALACGASRAPALSLPHYPFPKSHFSPGLCQLRQI